MPVLTPGKPVTVKEPHFLVENKLRPGRYRFQLIVFDDGGLESDPAEIIVSVHDRVRDPTRPVIREPIDVRILRDVVPIIRRPR